jgi:hypothetical protein
MFLTPCDTVCRKDKGLVDFMAKEAMCWEARGRAPSDEVSTAAPSPEASPLFGPQSSTPLSGPGELLLPDLGAFDLPDAQDSIEGSEAEFELFGFDDDEAATTAESELTRSDEKDLGEHSEEEDIESELLSLLGQLSSLRAEAREDAQRLLEESACSLQAIPYPELESGFLPAEFMPTSSWLLPPGSAQTGRWACAMAPRPRGMCMEPVNICFSAAGVALEIAPKDSFEYESKSPFEAKAVFRRSRGRSRSPLTPMLDRCLPDGCERGRQRLR